MDLAKLKAQLIKHEGLVLKPYSDTVGKVTIGVGHNLTDLGITKAQALSILDDDISHTIDFLQLRLPWVFSLDDVRQRAIIDMTFNLMGKILDFKRMLTALKNGDYEKAAAQLLGSLFARQVGKRAVTLAEMIRTGKDIND